MLENIDFIGSLYKALYLTLILSMPSILIASIVGTLFAVVQAVTQIQEQTLSFGVKLLVTSLTLWLTMRWIGNEILVYTEGLFNMIPYVGRTN